MTMAGSKRRNMKGGFLESLTSSLTDAWNKTKTAASGAYDSATGSATGTSTYMPTTPTSTSTSTYTPMGGKRRRTRRMRGGNFTDNTPTTGLAAHASPISGIPSVQAQMVGGRRTRRHRHRHRRSKSRRRR
jgi:hypothetical protein